MPTIKLIGTSASRVMRPLWMLEELRTNGGVLPNIQAWMQRCWSRDAAKVPRRARGEVI